CDTTRKPSHRLIEGPLSCPLFAQAPITSCPLFAQAPITSCPLFAQAPITSCPLFAQAPITSCPLFAQAPITSCPLFAQAPITSCPLFAQAPITSCPLFAQALIGRNAEPLALCNSVARAFVSAAGPAGGSTGQPRLTGRGARFGRRRHPVPRRGGTGVGVCDRRSRGRIAAGRDARHAHHRRRNARRRLRRRHPPAHRAARGAPGAGTHRSRRRGRPDGHKTAGARRRGAASAARWMVHGRSAERIGTRSHRGQSRCSGNTHE